MIIEYSNKILAKLSNFSTFIIKFKNELQNSSRHLKTFIYLYIVSMKANDWITTGAGYNVSHAFGFGLMDAGAMVKLAQTWTSVPKQEVS